MKSSVAVFAMLVVVCGFNHVIARPNSRIKRVSDSHLADLETKIAMNNRIRGFAITLPIGGGRIDPSQIGRKRRSDSRLLKPLFEQQSDDDNNDDYSYLYNYNFKNYQD